MGHLEVMKQRSRSNATAKCEEFLRTHHDRQKNTHCHLPTLAITRVLTPSCQRQILEARKNLLTT